MSLKAAADRVACWLDALADRIDCGLDALADRIGYGATGVAVALVVATAVGWPLGLLAVWLFG